ncbi:Kinetochore-Ndc80 complex, subunit Spc25 [halophilic archaeon DL31]|nr:Kinetochore-Ndc80 complex, subunit Spc25 [halophilic archaeon DL31]
MTTSSDPTTKQARLSARNIGGIDETAVEFGSGITVLEGRNATNRTSLLQAIMASCGSERVSMKADAETATVSLSVDGQTSERTLTREDGELVGTGDALVEDVQSAELFAFLLESNEARRAVARGDDLRELIMRPIDTASIRREIQEAEQRKRAIDDRLEELEALEHARPALEGRHEELATEIEETEEKLAAVEADIDDTSAAIGEERAQQEQLTEKLSELRALRNQLDDVRYDRETERASIERSREEQADLQEELSALPEPDGGELEEIRRQRDEHRSERSRLERKLNELDTVVQFNQEILEGSRETVLDALGDGGARFDSGTVTDQLVTDEEAVNCWTCGSSVRTDEIEQTVDMLRELRARTAEERDVVQAELDRLDERAEELSAERDRHEEATDRLQRIERELEEGEETLDSLDDRRESLEADIEAVEHEVEQHRDESRGELLELHERANELERELGRLDNERDTVEAELAEVREGLEERAALEDERVALQDRLVDLRTRIERIQEEVVETFNEQMETVLGLLGYENLDRVWIERTKQMGAEEASYHLHIVRNTEGTVYEDSIDHLSESEREVVGLVFALAGYLAHEVYDDCPFVLLDSLEAIDSERIAALVDHFQSYSDYLVVALLPEDAAAVDEDYERITDI